MIRPHTKVSRNIGNFSATARSVLLHQPNEFALSVFMTAIRVSHLRGCYFRKWEEIRQHCDVAAEFPAGCGSPRAVCPACNVLCSSICIFSSRRQSVQGGNHVPHARAAQGSKHNLASLSFSKIKSA